jgi:tetratricopeptide (TPR) repeat protein
MDRMLRRIPFCCKVVAMALRHKLSWFLFVFALAACQQAPADVQSTATSTVAPTAEVTASPTLSPDQLINLAQDASNRGDWQGAILLLDLAITQDPANTQILLLRGNAYREAGDFDQAITNYDQALAIDPELAAVYHNRALAYVKFGDPDAALVDFARAIEIAPTFGPAYRNRAELQLAAGNTAAAALDLEIYITLIPNAPDRAEVEAKIAELQAQTIANASPDGLLFADDFSDTESGWYTNGDPTSPGGYSGGGYVLQMKQTNAGVWAMPGRLFDDVRIEVYATKQGGDNDNFFGLMCRITSTSGGADFYIFMISSDGFYGIGKRVNSGDMLMFSSEGEQNTENRMFFSGKIHQGEATNKITAICSGDRLALFVNDQILMEVSDSAISEGQVGMVAGAREIPDTSIFFDDFAVYTEPAQ